MSAVAIDTPRLSRVVKYSQPVLRDIYDLARRGALDELTEYIRSLIVNG